MTDMHQQPYSPFELPAESSTVSLWKHTVEQPQRLATHYPPLQEVIVADIAIVGAGITGMTTALLLQQSGYSVAVIDAHPIGYGVTGFNSGHLTSMLLDTDFRRVLANFGEDATRIVTTHLQNTIYFIEQQVRENLIDCNFKRISGYLYAERVEQMKDLAEIEEAATRAGLRLSRVSQAPLPFSMEGALRIADQGRFHPLKYVQGLAAAFLQKGGSIYENSRVLDVKNGGTQAPFSVETEAGQILADEVVIATHTPIGFRPAIQSRMEAIRSYIIGFRSQRTVEDALFWDMEKPYHYLRESSDEHGRLLILGGEDHRTGEKQETDECFRRLEEYARRYFGMESVDYRWSAQFYDPVDGLPYIGKLAGTYIATGYSGEGLTFGTLAAQIIADQVQGVENPCGEILSPLRTKPIASAGGFIAENVNNITHFVKDRLNKADVVIAPESLSAQDIPPGEGRICEIEGRKAAVYHSPEGVMHFLSPVCTHMKCIVGWNTAEKSWDCPCHGGRFDATGKVLNGPPVVDLEPLDW
jgi:glycine/D-amino acid oxidase-like deaminating enzyme/nitrite reductase/ring-hydroxylating ferredoxin subunit